VWYSRGMYDAAWQLRVEGRCVVALPWGSSWEAAEVELARIVADSGVARASFQWDGLLLTVRRVSWWGAWLHRVRAWFGRVR